MSNSKMVMSQAANSWAGPTYIEDVFSTYLYTGNSSTQTITNGIDLAGEGGMVWIKARSAANSHAVYDTLRGNTLRLNTNTTGAAQDTTTSLSSFNSNGFSLSGSNNQSNESPTTYTSWTFRKAERFFDVVTYTGNGTSNRQIAHNLGTTVGSVIIKETSGVKNWGVWHRSFANVGDHMYLNTTGATVNNTVAFGSTLPTETNFNVGAFLNSNGATYVAYLFAHDPLGPSGDGSDGLISCGSFTTDGSGNATVDLGWEPQYVLYKKSSGNGSWTIFDTMRGFATGLSNDNVLWANLSDAEIAGANGGQPEATGFSVSSIAASSTYIYIAIRRGPMREPESGTEVFSPVTSTSAQDTKLTTGFPVDMQMITWRTNTVSTNTTIVDRLRGVSTSTSGGVFPRLISSSTDGEDTAGVTSGWDNTGFRTSGAYANISTVYQNFRRAPGFFDVVAYTGTGTLNPIGHNLTVNPELIIFKRRAAIQDWWVIHYATDKSLRLNTTAAGTTADVSIYGPVTSTTFVPYLNTSGLTHIAYLFATLPGISKVGSYTGNGSSQTINCGFTTGARFILIKRTDSTGDWYVWDTARGIVAGNDPHLSLNTTAAEVTTDDTIDPDSSGFIVNQVAATNVNVNAASYIYLAIA